MTDLPPLRVLVVDDSAFARKIVREQLSTSPLIEVVATARDGIDALEKIAELDPDVITLDMVMPNLDGLGVLAALSEPLRARVVVVSMADESSDVGVAALQAGIFDLVRKPSGLAIATLQDMGGELVEKVVAAGHARRVRVDPAVEAVSLPPITPLVPPATTERVVLIGTSTGGPQALTALVKALPADFPAPVAIVLHIPPGYTGPLAARLNDLCALEVVEASEGIALRPGLVILARAGVHLRIVERGSGPVVHLDPEPYLANHRPSVDALFESAAESLGRRALGVVLTGMGNDGLAGAQLLKRAGGELLTEAESSCVVYGMPRVIWEAGLASAQAPLDRMLAAITARL